MPGCAPHDLRGAAALIFHAEGDLDGDGERSILERSAALSPDQSELIAVRPLRIERRAE